MALFLGLSMSMWGQTKAIPQQFNPPRLVSDYVSLLSRGEYQALEQKLVAYNDTTSIQIAVIIEASSEGEDIFTYAQRLAEAWGIGQGDTDNGVLLLVMTEDRRMRIHTGYGTEQFLTDAMSRRITDNVLVPNFRSGNYYQGIDRATDIIMQLGTGEYQAKERESEDFPVILMVFLIIAAIVIISFILNNTDGGDDGGYWRGGRYDHYGPRRSRGGWIITSGGGGFGGGGLGGGGGFGGFGGGGFGGGGASGSW